VAVTLVSEARDAILARIHAALGPEPVVPDVPRHYRLAGSAAASEALVARFAERVTDYRATVHDSVAGAVGARGLARLACAPGIRAAVDGLELISDDPPLEPSAIEALDGVLTGCAVAIAETGTIVLDGSSECGRRALSLIPDYHLCVVRRSQVVESVPEAVALLRPAADAGRPITLISGPSATSDIELDRVEGVHGPRTLDVVLLDDA
jgi:L-lactate dehydrogenase complex protein LldG